MKRPAKPTNATPSSASHLNADTISQTELLLIRKLRDAPRQHSYRFSKDAEYSLLEDLFSSLTCNKPEYLHYIFPNGPSSSTKPWNLSEAQGAVEGAEYSAAARGKPCGHIFKNGEATYRCKSVIISASQKEAI